MSSYPTGLQHCNLRRQKGIGDVNYMVTTCNVHYMYAIVCICSNGKAVHGCSNVFNSDLKSGVG